MSATYYNETAGKFAILFMIISSLSLNQMDIDTMTVRLYS